MSIGLGEAMGGRGTGGEDGRSWSKISTTLCIVSGIPGRLLVDRPRWILICGAQTLLQGTVSM
jgi:hypothetical protein